MSVLPLSPPTGLVGSNAWNATIPGAHPCGDFWCCDDGKSYSMKLQGCCAGDECSGIAGSNGWKSRSAHQCGNYWSPASATVEKFRLEVMSSTAQRL